MDKTGYTAEFYVRSYECGADRQATLTTLVNYMQELAGLHSSSVGLSIDVMTEMGLAWVLYKWKVRIYTYPKMEEKVRVHTWSSHMDKLHAYRCFTLYNESGTVIGEAASVWVMLDLKKRSLCPIPQHIVDAYPCTEETYSFLDEFTNNPLPLAGDQLSASSFIVHRHDLDYNHHVNNVRYIEFLMDSLPEDLWKNAKVCDMEVTYKKECTLGDEITCLSFDTKKEESTGQADNEKGTTIVSLIKPSGEENNRRAHTYFKLTFRPIAEQ